MGKRKESQSRRKQSCFEFIALGSNLRHSATNYHYFYTIRVRILTRKYERGN